MPTMHLIIKGKVQGVFYRATAKEVANTLGVTGWIRNTEDGDVECEVSGDEQQLHEFVAWCRNGPEHAVVAHVELNQVEERTYEAFDVRRY